MTSSLIGVMLLLYTFAQNVGLGKQAKPVTGMLSTSIPSSGAVYLRGYCATYIGVESVAVAEARRTADYQTTVYDCVNKLLERCTEDHDENETCADHKQGKVRVNFHLIIGLIICNFVLM